jgi:hypothetical protein
VPFVLIIIGVVFLDAAVRNTVSDSSNGPGLATLLKGDFTGPDNFLYWLTAILIIGSIGYIDALKPISRMFMVLVVLVLFLSNGGFFTKAMSELFGKDIQLSPSASASTPSSNSMPQNELTQLLGQSSGSSGSSTLTNAEGESVPVSLIGN